MTSIKNVLHKFLSFAGVREDVTDIVLNVRRVAPRRQGEEPKRLPLSASGSAYGPVGLVPVDALYLPVRQVASRSRTTSNNAVV